MTMPFFRFYAVALGHDNKAVARLMPQPRCEGLNYIAWVYTSIGDEPNGHQIGKLLWDSSTPTKMEVVIAQLGLDTRNNREVTLTLPVGIGRRLGYFNCYVSYPKNLRFLDFTNDTEIDVRVVEQIA